MNTPIEVNLMILDNCVFGAMLHGIEPWGVEKLKEDMELKEFTSNDLIFHD